MAMTKAAQMRIAAQITQALGDFERALIYPKSKLKWQSLFRSTISFGFLNGEALLFENANTSKLSAHEQMTLQVWKTELLEDATQIAQLFQQLYPGTALTWDLGVMDAQSDNYHTLRLGIRNRNTLTNQSHPHVINTVLKRWKAPLVRLAQYLALEKPEFADIQWLIRTNDSLSNNTGVCGRMATINVCAHTSEEAFRLFSFYNGDHSAGPKPKATETTLIANVINPDKRYKQSTLDTFIAKTLETRGGIPVAILEQAKSLQNTLNTLDTERKGQLTIDLVTGKTTARFHDHALANDQDIADNQPIREQAKALLDKLSNNLMVFLDDIHPNRQQGTLSIDAGATLNTGVMGWTWTFILDGYKSSLDYRTLDALVEAATLLNKTDVQTSPTTYVIFNDFENWRVETNRSVDTVVIKAGCPRHAWVIYKAKGNTANMNGKTQVMNAISPIRSQDRQTALDIMKAAQNKHYG